jgi:hypothetical protein
MFHDHHHHALATETLRKARPLPNIAVFAARHCIRRSLTNELAKAFHHARASRGVSCHHLVVVSFLLPAAAGCMGPELCQNLAANCFDPFDRVL